MLHGNEVGMGAGRPGAGQGQHARSEGGEDPAVLRHHPCCVQAVEKAHHVGVGTAVVGHDRPVADTEAEEEAARVPGIEVGDVAGEVLGRGHPDAGDAARHRHCGGRGEEAFEARRETGLETGGGPQRRVPERLGSAATETDSSSSHRHEPLHQMPSLPRSTRASVSSYCSDMIAANSASGSRTTGPVTSTTALVMVPVKGKGAS